jgi:prepilin-type N-terminal cleavage/methylation domain-containing protein
MKTHHRRRTDKGFTLIELLVAMVITTIIVGVLVSVTAVALDTWNSSRAELRASRQAKSMIDTVSRDFESLLLRRGNNKFEWLSAKFDTDTIGENIKSANASKLIFFTGSTDRYEGEIGVGGKDNGGDVSCVGYRLEYRNPLNAANEDSKTYVFNRLLVDPDETFRELLGKDDLVSAFSKYESKISEPKNFICENVVQFTITFHVQVVIPGEGASPPKTVNIPVKMGEASSSETTNEFAFRGDGIKTQISSSAVTNDQLKSGRISAVEISTTVLTDYAIDQLRTRKFSSVEKQAKFLKENSYEYTKLTQISAF